MLPPRRTAMKATFLLLGIASTAEAASYCNSRYSYCINVPAAMYGQGESDSGDGQVFMNRSATVTLTVWGAWNVPDLPSFEDEYREASRGWPSAPGRPARVVTYKVMKPDFFVVSGIEGGKVFYQRTIKSAKNASMATYLLQYRDGDKTAQSYIKALTAGFKVLR
ncbi:MULTISPECIES: hypothetical protein [unclassified Deinococcus]|uniref:hypothetical protein n=1 Tax=unclassified Deinococcus TaxID=2623546 RepID=UPI001C2FBF76|nr:MULTISPECIES: hypothetical protein [unclassified Deinococcus]MDK2010986.1 hypothetical protein [Deinococcus sp. 43]